MRRRRRGFTLVEILVVISIIAVLAGILLPTLTAVSGASKVANTERLIENLILAITAFENDKGYYPPDCLDTSITPTIYSFVQADLSTPNVIDLDANQYPPQALFYYLTNPAIGENAPYTSLREDAEYRVYTEAYGEMLPSVIDAWGRPILYNRKPRSDQADCKGTPHHNTDSYDIFSIGPDGKTSKRDEMPEAGSTLTTLGAFCDAAIGDQFSGNDEDDICNWTKIDE
jgi:prepilin-type N-terminal cleavage/methylation domain-containing protein